MGSFDITQKINEIIEERLDIQYLKQTMELAVCPYEKQWLQDRLFTEVDHALEITSELYRHLQKDNEKKAHKSRQNTEFTPDELSNFNGTNGKPAYVAVNGVVYDVSNEATWGGASHFGLMAGKDLTAEFNGCHGMISVLSNLPKVGVMK